MATPYEKLYENLLPKFRSYEIPLMSTEEVKDFLHDFLIPAVSRFHVCRKDLNDRDDIVQRFNVDLSDIEIEILSNYLLIEYMDSEYIRTPSLLKVQLPSSDFKVFSPANFLDKLVTMHKTYVTENETLLTRYAWMGAKESGVKLGAGYKKNKNF
jgi:hypothetical protein